MLNDALKYQKQNSDPAVWLLPNVFDMSLYPPPVNIISRKHDIIGISKERHKKYPCLFLLGKGIPRRKVHTPRPGKQYFTNSTPPFLYGNRSFLVSNYIVPQWEYTVLHSQIYNSRRKTVYSPFYRASFLRGRVIFNDSECLSYPHFL